MLLDPSGSFYESIGRIEAAVLLTVIVSVVVFHRPDVGCRILLRASCQSITSIRKLARLIRES